VKVRGLVASAFVASVFDWLVCYAPHHFGQWACRFATARLCCGCGKMPEFATLSVGGSGDGADKADRRWRGEKVAGVEGAILIR